MPERLDERSPAMTSVVDAAERSGTMLPLFEGSLGGCTHEPAELEAAIERDAGLDLLDVVGVEEVALRSGRAPG